MRRLEPSRRHPRPRTMQRSEGNVSTDSNDHGSIPSAGLPHAFTYEAAAFPTGRGETWFDLDGKPTSPPTEGVQLHDYDAWRQADESLGTLGLRNESRFGKFRSGDLLFCVEERMTPDRQAYADALAKERKAGEDDEEDWEDDDSGYVAPARFLRAARGYELIAFEARLGNTTEVLSLGKGQALCITPPPPPRRLGEDELEEHPFSSLGDTSITVVRPDGQSVRASARPFDVVSRAVNVEARYSHRLDRVFLSLTGYDTLWLNAALLRDARADLKLSIPVTQRHRGVDLERRQPATVIRSAYGVTNVRAGERVFQLGTEGFDDGEEIVLEGCLEDFRGLVKWSAAIRADGTRVGLNRAPRPRSLELQFLDHDPARGL